MLTVLPIPASSCPPPGLTPAHPALLRRTRLLLLWPEYSLTCHLQVIQVLENFPLRGQGLLKRFIFIVIKKIRQNFKKTKQYFKLRKLAQFLHGSLLVFYRYLFQKVPEGVQLFKEQELVAVLAGGDVGDHGHHLFLLHITRIRKLNSHWGQNDHSVLDISYRYRYLFQSTSKFKSWLKMLLNN